MKKPGQGVRKAPAKRHGAAKVQDHSAVASDLRLRAESRLPKLSKSPDLKKALTSDAETRRLLHELQVHQIELEMQNAELQECRNQAETLLDKYVALYDFAPVGYFSLDKKGRILEVNLTGAALLGVVRSRLVSRLLPRFAERPFRAVLLDLIAQVFAENGKQVGEIRLQKDDGTTFWAGLYACPAFASDPSKNVCRMAISDITVSKQAEEARRHVEILTHSNEALEQEIVRRQAVEDALKNSELHQSQLLEQSRGLQEKLRKMSRSSLQALEDERRRISRDLHDDIAQTLVGINVHLASLAGMPAISPKLLRRKILRTQRLVEASVKSVIKFALELRPPSLDDLGLIIALNTLLKDFMSRTGIRVHFKVYADVDKLNSDQRIALYRIAQTALSNVGEHAQATHVELRISKTADDIHLQVTDNGKPFDVPRTAALRSGKHLGLISMRERAEMMGGTFRIESKPGNGTIMHAQIPLASDSDDQDPVDISTECSHSLE